MTPARRVVKVGNTGAGESTLARRLAAALGLDHLEPDTAAGEPDPVAVPRAPEGLPPR